MATLTAAPELPPHNIPSSRINRLKIDSVLIFKKKNKKRKEN
jgi:hypothetical protein